MSKVKIEKLKIGNESRNSLSNVNKSLSSKTTEDFKGEFLNTVGG